MTRLSGAGRRRTRVGTARIWSPAASCGCTSRSMTSMCSARPGAPRRCGSGWRSRRWTGWSARRRKAAGCSLPLGRRGGFRPLRQRFAHVASRDASWEARARCHSFRRAPARAHCLLVAPEPHLMLLGLSTMAQFLLLLLECRGVRRLPLDRGAAPSTCRRRRAALLASAPAPRPAPGPPGPAGPSRSAPPGPDVELDQPMPAAVSRNSRIWLECAMPRDFRT